MEEKKILDKVNIMFVIKFRVFRIVDNCIQGRGERGRKYFRTRVCQMVGEICPSGIRRDDGRPVILLIVLWECERCFRGARLLGRCLCVC